MYSNRWPSSCLGGKLYTRINLWLRVKTRMQHFFPVASDASNHGSTKLFPLAVRYWTPELWLKKQCYWCYEDREETLYMTLSPHSRQSSSSDNWIPWSGQHCSMAQAHKIWLHLDPFSFASLLQMNMLKWCFACWRQHEPTNETGVDLIKSEIQVKNNFAYSCIELQQCSESESPTGSCMVR